MPERAGWCIFPVVCVFEETLTHRLEVDLFVVLEDVRELFFCCLPDRSHVSVLVLPIRVPTSCTSFLRFREGAVGDSALAGLR